MAFHDQIPPNTSVDLLSLAILAVLLAVAGILRFRRPEDEQWRLQYRVGLWLIVWAGGALLLRMLGYA